MVNGVFTIDDMGNITTSVYIKPTDKGVYTNYLSHICQTHNYKKSIIKTLVIRAIKYSLNWLTFNSEIDRIKQVLVNNNFPLYLIDTIVQRSLSKHLTPSDVMPNDPITFYVRLNNLHTMKLDEKTLKNILPHHVIPTNKYRQIKFISYLKPVKLCSFFSTRLSRTNLEKASVVYQFSCTEAGCQASYIGHTTCTLKMRGLQHQ